MLNKVSPTSLGFHCDGDCWDKHGGINGLFFSLHNTSKELRDWFVNAEWTENSATHIALPSIGLICPIQAYIVPETVDFYVEGKMLKHDKEFYDIFPTLFLWNEKIHIFQGTHRLAALYQQGENKYRGWFVDLDEMIRKHTNA